MPRMRLLLLVSLFTAIACAQPAPAESPWTDANKVEVKGTVERVHAAPGQGMPYLVLKRPMGASLRVMLGSMRYLLEHNFNPKAGSAVLVNGFQVGETIYARSVSLPTEKMTIELRDDKGVPLWRMGRYGWRGK